jgi:hypothetical protein
MEGSPSEFIAKEDLIPLRPARHSGPTGRPAAHHHDGPPAAGARAAEPECRWPPGVPRTGIRASRSTQCAHDGAPSLNRLAAVPARRADRSFPAAGRHGRRGGPPSRPSLFTLRVSRQAVTLWQWKDMALLLGRSCRASHGQSHLDRDLQNEQLDMCRPDRSLKIAKWRELRLSRRIYRSQSHYKHEVIDFDSV